MRRSPPDSLDLHPQRAGDLLPLLRLLQEELQAPVQEAEEVVHLQSSFQQRHFHLPVTTAEAFANDEFY